MNNLRQAAQQALEALEKCSDWPGAYDACSRAVHSLRAALAEPDLDHCPKCGGPADNGHDRCIPPNPYFCSKCMAEPEQERPHPDYPCRSDGRCQYAIDSGAEGLGHCPPGKCCMAARLEPTAQEIQNAAENLALMKRMFPQPEQEPVAVVKYMETGGNAGIATRIVEIDDPLRERLRAGTLLFTAATPRTWFGLTNEEIDVGLCRSPYALQTARAWRDGVEWAQAQLKEKNA